MIEKVTVIGLGTLGGFLTKHISELDTIREIVIVDFDIIERRNTINSIYSIANIGEYKVDALAEMLENAIRRYQNNLITNVRMKNGKNHDKQTF